MAGVAALLCCAQMASTQRIATVPNLVTAVRLACLPVFVWLVFGVRDRATAAWLLAGLGATDWVDGFVARRYDQVSDLGKVLDPTADRLLLATAVISIVVAGAVPLWLFAIVVAREALVSGAVLFLAARGAPRIDVLWVGKAGTFGLMCALPLFLGSHSDLSWHSQARVAAWVCAVPGVILAWAAAAAYVGPARRALSAARVRSTS